jgi:hypothetical protein
MVANCNPSYPIGKAEARRRRAPGLYNKTLSPKNSLIKQIN